MCQAYEAERAAIVSGENYSTRKGFTAAAIGANLEDNPLSWSIYDGQAWYHGFACWHEGLLPWAIESHYVRDRLVAQGKSAYGGEAQQLVSDFRNTGRLPTWLLRELEIPDDAISPLQYVTVPDIAKEQEKKWSLRA